MQLIICSPEDIDWSYLEGKPRNVDNPVIWFPPVCGTDRFICKWLSVFERIWYDISQISSHGYIEWALHETFADVQPIFWLTNGSFKKTFRRFIFVLNSCIHLPFARSSWETSIVKSGHRRAYIVFNHWQISPNKTPSCPITAGRQNNDMGLSQCRRLAIVL